jgi:ribosome maturation factor RimP
MPRQFQKNIGRSLRLTLADRSTREGKLSSTTGEGFILEYTKKEGKKKISVEEPISYQELHQAFVNISFR